MKRFFHLLLSCVVIWQLTAGTFLLTISAQTNKSQTEKTKGVKQTPDQTKPPTKGSDKPTDAAAQDINNGSGNGTGITVGKPKQFDERTLSLMLQSLEQKLAQTQFPDPNGLYGTVGRFAGATAETTSMALNIKGQALPSVTTTLGNTSKEGNTGTGLDETTQTTTVAPTGTTLTNVAKNSSTTGFSNEISNTSQQQITQPGLAPPSAVLLPQTSIYSYQPQFGIASQDLLAEQTSLFYQIVNLRLLLDRSLTDRLNIAPLENNAGTSTTPRDQIVLGFQISIDAAHKDAVAEAEISIVGQDVSLVSLLPRDKTYNVASVTKDSKAVDMGAVVQFIGIGASASKTQESVYLVKDTDTVALERPSQTNSAKFAWQFRPVLGRRTVEPGMRQVYALVSVPRNGKAWNGQITATTKWRRYDRKTKTVGELVKGTTENTEYNNFNKTIANSNATDYALKPYITQLSYSDAGNGQILVIAEGGGFTPDTTIVLGNTVLNRPENGLTIANERRLLVLAPAQMLAQSPPLIVGRYGTTEFTRPQCMRYPETPLTAPCKDLVNTYSDLSLQSPVIKARDSINSEVEVQLIAKNSTVDIPYRFKYHPPVVVIGNKIFGLSDAPFIPTECLQTNNLPCVKLTFVVPTQLLANSSALTVKEFLWNSSSKLETALALPNKFSITGLTTLGTNGGSVQLAILGGGFTKDIRVLVGETSFAVSCAAADTNCASGLRLNSDNGTATMITLSPTKAQIKDVKQIIVSQGIAQPQPISLTQPPPSIPTAKIIQPSDSLTVAKGDSLRVKFEGANFESIKKVLFEGKELAFKVDDDDKTILWVDLQTFLTGETGKKRIVFLMKDEKEVPFIITVKP